MDGWSASDIEAHILTVEMRFAPSEAIAHNHKPHIRTGGTGITNLLTPLTNYQDAPAVTPTSAPVCPLVCPLHQPTPPLLVPPYTLSPCWFRQMALLRYTTTN